MVETAKKTARAVRVPAANNPALESVSAAIAEPESGQVRIRIHACGVCHSDVLTVRNLYPNISYPRVPGHEIAGTIDAIGSNVTGWKIGDRVGVGWHGGHDGTCDRCRRGDFLTCRALQIPGIAYDGGYADYTIVPAAVLARIPDKLSFEEAAPLMCAGITTFNSLRHSGAKPGDVVAVLGIGGLGHLAVQYANRMGFHTIAIARGKEKEADAMRFGAVQYVDSQAADPAAELQKLGGANVILSTVTSGRAVEPLLSGLGVDGELVILGAADAPLSVNTAGMIGARQSIKAWPSGTNVDSEDTMRFSVLTGVRAEIERMPLDRAAEAYQRMMDGKARFRMVLTMTG